MQVTNTDQLYVKEEQSSDKIAQDSNLLVTSKGNLKLRTYELVNKKYIIYVY